MKHTHRYYLSPVYGDGVKEPYHAKIQMYPVCAATSIVMDGKTGKLMDDVALVLVSGSDDDHASLAADHELLPCKDHADAIGKSFEFGKKLRETARALNALKVKHIADLKLAHERRDERRYNEQRLLGG